MFLTGQGTARSGQYGETPATATASARPGTLRLYYLHPLLAGPVTKWPGLLEHIRKLGFSHVVCAPVFMPGGNGDVFITADHDRLHPLLGEDAAEEGLRQMVRACRSQDLGFVLDIVPDRVAAEGRLAAAHPDWVRLAMGGGQGLPDPRRPPRAPEVAVLQLQHPEVAEAARSWWAARLQALLQAGVEGFRFLGIDRAPPTLWGGLLKDLRNTNAEALLLAWTPGVDAGYLERLQTADFDAVFLSTCWWDWRSDWYPQEHERLRRLGLPLATVEPPFGPRAAAHEGQAPGLSPLYHSRRLLQLASLTGCGWLMPMGFEFGVREALQAGRGSPRDWAAWQTGPDLRAAVAEANARLRNDDMLAVNGELRLLSAPEAECAALLRGDHPDLREAQRAVLILGNAGMQAPVTIPWPALLARSPGLAPEPEAVAPGEGAVLQPHEVRTIPLQRAAPVMRTSVADARAAARRPRIAIEDIAPAVDAGRFAIKRIAGETVQVEAAIFADGHTALGAALLWRADNETDWHEVPMRFLGNDRWAAGFRPPAIGRYWYTIAAWIDDWGSFTDGLRKKRDAGRDVQLEMQEGEELLRRIAAAAEASTLREQLATAAAELSALDAAARTERLLDPALAAAVGAAGWRPFRHEHQPPLPLQSEPQAAAYGSWYELFPRSQSGDEGRHGTFADVITRLPAIRAMGFDVLYFPPIHPIGRSHRKGRNNALEAGPEDPGSPYAIGSSEGGHDALHPQLGDFADFARLREAAAAQGLQLALDFAIQCSPDHPWLQAHPGWFAWRPDGSIAYAENPPKKYEDIVNVDFYGAAAIPDLWEALRDVVLFWVQQGVRLFRVDNPHTKPLPFWEWLIDQVQARHPDVVFLSEAFTRPKPMQRLAKLGFAQSYTYFTWRHGKGELTEYFRELAEGPAREYFRPHLFVNTPDINPFFLQSCGRAGFLIRAALATTLSGLWGMYNGFELCEARAMPGKEEYADSEKYQLRAWDWDRPGNIIKEIALLNRIRRSNPALHSHLGLRFYNAWNDHILYYGRMTPERDNVLLVAINLDPFHVQDADFEVPLWEWSRGDDAAMAAEDLWHGHRFVWHGKRQHLRLDPAELPFAIWRLRPGAAV